MDFTSFLQNFSLEFSTICFKVNHNQPFFLRAFAQFYARKLQRELMIIDPEHDDLSQVSVKLATSFLGQQFVYWIKDFRMLATVEQDKLIKLIDHSCGEHAIIFSTELTSSIKGHQKNAVVVLPDTLTFVQAQNLLESFYGTVDRIKEEFIRKLFERLSQLSPDQLLLLYNYQKVLGRGQDLFFEKWLDLIIEPEQSLFVLSQHFFARSDQFFRHWEQIKQNYSTEYWITFWSQQIWQALIFIEKAQAFGPQEARKSVTRLPFSFMQKDWKLVTFNELCRAHEYLYTVDNATKNGSGTIGIELFLHNFIHRMFQAKNISIDVL